MLVIAIVAWWTFAVIVWVTIINDSGRDTKDLMLAVGLAVFWPAIAVGVIPVLIYQACVPTTARIRVDLKNRGILKEFEQWLKDRDGKILPKDE
jgi:hypothetical protein